MRYFFNVRTDERVVLDLEGQELPSEEAARLEAISAAKEIVGRELLNDGAVDWKGAIEIVANDLVIDRIAFLQAVGLHPEISEQS